LIVLCAPVGDCENVYVCGGHPLSLLTVPCADAGGCERISVEGCLVGSFGGRRHVVLSLNNRRLGVDLAAVRDLCLMAR
jgi:hypothetical protein